MARHHHTHRGRVVAGLLVLLSTLAALMLAATPASADPGDHSPKPEKSSHTSLSPGDSRDLVEVKFVEGSDVRVRGNRFVTRDGGKIATLDSVLARFPGLKLSRTFEGLSEDDLDKSRHEAEERSGDAQDDMNLFFRIGTGPKTDIVALIDALNALDLVAIAAPASEPAAAPVTPSFVWKQGYRTASASGGIDADFVQSLSGGKGENVGIIDVEYSWNRTHEDLSKLRATGSLIANGTACDPFAAKDGLHATDHGTAVMGELAGDPNAIGVTGLAPSASIRTVNASSIAANGTCSLALANAIAVAAANSAPGDVILIEQQTDGPRWTGTGSDPQFGYVPVEWKLPVWTAIKNATSRGVIVIEPAGNGSQNLDDPIYNGWFSSDSGAIIVGAGSAPGCTADPARGRLWYSNYGARLNVQGWGNCVATAGYGALQGGTDANYWYTSGFGGTSSASPIVASAAALISSIAEGRGTTLTPGTIRSLLTSTGVAQQFGSTGKIGPLPNLRAAVDALGPKLTETEHVVIEGGTLGSDGTVPVRNSWTSTGSAPVRYEVYLSTDSGPFVKQSISGTSASNFIPLARNHDYRFAARAADAAGIWGDWAYGTTFNLGVYQEDYTGGTPTYTGNWVRSYWAPASDGYLKVADVTGSSATFSFTGTNVAWIATKATNRGQADVYVDGLFAKTVDLYSSTNVPQFVAFTKTWATSGTHTLEVRVRGTVGRPKVDIDAFVRLR